MIIKKVGARSILDSRGKPTIEVFLQTDSGYFSTSAPSGKSKGEYEKKPYSKNLNSDIKYFNNLDVDILNKLNVTHFNDLKKIERLVKNNIGANSLFCFEATILKALAKEKKLELWEYIRKSRKNIVFPRPVGNAIGGGVHSKGVGGEKPDFQEFLFIPKGESFFESVKINSLSYKLVNDIIKSVSINDEGAYETYLDNEETLKVMRRVSNFLKNTYNYHVDIGIDVAASIFYKNSRYVYKNLPKKLNKIEQVHYINSLINKYRIFYIEDPLEENDFIDFRKLKNIVENSLIVGDDLTTTNPIRLKKAIRMHSISGIIVKPNQIGSLLKVKEVIDLAKSNHIKTIISHRSGETLDDTIADLAIAFNCDFIKTGINGKVREAKLRRLIDIERELL